MFDAVIIATRQTLRVLVRSSDRDLADDLQGITYSSSVTLTLRLHMDQIKHLPRDWFLGPAQRDGAYWRVRCSQQVSAPRTGGQGHLRCFMGGARDRRC